MLRRTIYAGFGAIVIDALAPSAGARAQSVPEIIAVSVKQIPTVPAGLKVACFINATTLAPSPTCVVVKYQGVTTWALSFIDNSYQFALVSYDAQGHIVRSVTYPGARYVWQIVSNPMDKTITVLGQAGPVKYASGDMPYSINVSWAALGK